MNDTIDNQMVETQAKLDLTKQLEANQVKEGVVFTQSKDQVGDESVEAK